MQAKLTRLFFGAFLVLGVAVQPAFAFKLNPWAPSTTDYLVRLQALTYIKEVPDHLQKIATREQKAQTDRAAEHGAQKDRLEVAKARVIEDLDKLAKAIAAGQVVAQKEDTKLKGEKKAQLADLRDELEANQRVYEEAVAGLKNWFIGKTTPDDVDEAKENLDDTRAAIEDLEKDLQEMAVLEPSPDLSQALLISQAAKGGIEAQLDTIAKTMALPADQAQRFAAEKDAWKESGVCMLSASHCKDKSKNDVKVENYDGFKDLRAELARCVEENVQYASKATKSKNSPSCTDISGDSTVAQIKACVQDYRTNDLKKPEIADSYEEYDKCAGMATLD